MSCARAIRSVGVVARPLLAASGALWLSLGCMGGQSGAEAPSGEGGTGGTGVAPGQVECTLDAECNERLTSELEYLSQPAAVSVEIESSRCESLGVSTEFRQVTGNTCYCDKADGGELYIGPAGLGCHLLGRDGQCIFSDADYTACDERDPDACAAVCDEAARRIEADAARPVATELILSECREQHCSSVVSLNGRCYANRDWQFGKGFDCSLGAEAILGAAVSANAPPELTPVADGNNPYPEGTSATLWLQASADWYGGERVFEGFGPYAQFYEVGPGTPAEQLDVIDPLQGLDDCGIFRHGSAGAAPLVEFSNVDRAVLRDAGSEHVLEEFQSGSGAHVLYSYGVDLLGVGAVPRYGQSYGFSASGGSFGAAIDIDGIVLPEALAFPGLERLGRLEPGALDLSWQGRGSAPLRVSLTFSPVLGGTFSSLSIECLLQDDGAFQIPSEIIAAAPEGLVLAVIRRENRRLVSSGGKSIQTIAAAHVNHRFALGPACDGAATMAACLASADTIAASYTACGVEPPLLATLCPDYLNEACDTCPEYFECVAEGTSCDAAGLRTGTNCSCP